MADKNIKIAMLAAHGGSDSNKIPLGGGAAICERLLQAWKNVDGLEITLIVPGYYKTQNSAAPAIAAESALESDCAINEHEESISKINTIQIPLLKEGETPCNLSEFRYAKFCRQFEKASTKKLLELKPDIAITHDISEGPNFKQLNKHNIPCIPIFHVDVVDFFCRMYLREYCTPKKCVNMWEKIRLLPIVPDILRLVFDKQADAVRYCPKLIVPSQGMKKILLDTYGNNDNLNSKIEVIPWGAPTPQFSHSEIEDAIPQINSEYNLNPEDPVIVMLSRISPEKAQNKLIEALSWGEQIGRMPSNLTVFICGTASFMQGPKFMRKLEDLSQNLKRVRLIFPGHIGGLKKAAILSRATVFVTTSKHESYGLTTMEAMQQGTPAVAIETPGSLQTIRPHTGVIIPRQGYTAQKLWHEIYNILINPNYRQILSDHAKLWSEQETFLKAAQKILHIFEAISQTQNK